MDDIHIMCRYIASQFVPVQSALVVGTAITPVLHLMPGRNLWEEAGHARHPASGGQRVAGRPRGGIRLATPFNSIQTYRYRVNSHLVTYGGQGESLVPPYTHRTVSLSLTLCHVTWRAYPIRPWHVAPCGVEAALEADGGHAIVSGPLVYQELNHVKERFTEGYEKVLEGLQR